MKANFILYIVMTCGFISFGWATDKENISPNLHKSRHWDDKNSSVHEQEGLAEQDQGLPDIKQFTQKIKQAQLDINTGELIILKDKFDQLNYTEKLWKELCISNNIMKWPSQTWKIAFGGHIFYPYEDIKIIESYPSNNYLISRPDTLFFIMISASYQNPEAQVLASKALDMYGFSSKGFVNRLYEDGKTTLEAVITNKESDQTLASLANYILAKNYQYSSKKKFKLYQNSDSLMSQLEILNIRRSVIGFDEPSIEEYIDLGKKGVGEAYYKAALIEEDRENKIKFLDLAYKKGYVPALLEVGKYYYQWGNVNQSTEFYLRYAQAGYSHGYIEAAFNLIGERFGGKSPNPSLEHKDINKVTEAIELLKAGVINRNPQAAYCLGILYQEVAKINKNKDDYNQLSQEAFIEGTRLGDVLSFYRLHNESRSKASTHPQIFDSQFKVLYGLS